MQIESNNFILVNVHVPYEGEIPRTCIHPVRPYRPKRRSPAGRQERRDSSLLSERSHEQIAGDELSAMGYTNVSHLAGGMIDWAASGNEVLQQK